MSKEIIKEITKAVLAVIIIVGAISLIWYEPSFTGGKELIIGLAGIAVGYYFRTESRGQLLEAIRK